MLNLDERIEEAKKIVPEIMDNDISVVKKLYEIIFEKYSEEKQELLRVYLLGYLLTMNEEVNFEEIQISNVVLKEGTGNDNPYFRMYSELLKLMGTDENVATVGVI
jgi:hypothetical protein|nr:MAG TPA: hypothetical protein [Caudoviricetes sp.]